MRATRAQTVASKQPKAKSAQKASNADGASTSKGKAEPARRVTRGQPRKKQRTGAAKQAEDRKVQQQPVLEHEGLLPAELLGRIGFFLRPIDMIRARQACRLWAAALPCGVEAIDFTVHPDSERTRQKLSCVKRVVHSPPRLAARTSSRLAQGSFNAFIDHVRTELPRLRELALVHTHVAAALPGIEQSASEGWKSIATVTRLRSLVSLSLTDTFSPSLSDIQELANLSNLRTLVLAPHQGWGATSLTDPATAVTMAEAMACTLEDLSNLRHLELTASPDQPLQPLVKSAGEAAAEGKGFQHLTCLVLSGGSKPAPVAKDHSYTHFKTLQRLDVEVCLSVSPSDQALGLASLKNLKELGLTLRGHIPRLSFNSSGVLGNTLTRLVMLDQAHVNMWMDLAFLRALKVLEVKECYPGSGLARFTSYEAAEVVTCGDNSLTSLRLLEPADHVSRVQLAPLIGGIKCRWTGLATLQLDGLMSTDAAGDALNGLKDLVSLRHLTLSGSDVTPHLIEVSSDCLPPLLESLALKYVLLSNPGSFGAAVRELSTLSLTHCAAPRLPPGEGLRQLLGSWSSLDSLESLSLCDIPDLKQAHIGLLAPLVSLKSLSLTALGSTSVNNAALGMLTGLTKLRTLKWQAGDVLDSILDPVVLRHFVNLHHLVITSSMYWRMTRWSALGVLAFLPFCQIEAAGA